MRQIWLALVMVVVVGCGPDGARIAPADAISAVPLDGWKRIVANDADRLWLTDADGLARYDRRTERWSRHDLPGDGESVDQVVGVPVDGVLSLLVSYCSGPCARMRENLAGIRAFVWDDDGFDEMPLERNPRRFADIGIAGVTRDAALFSTSSDGSTWFFSVSGRSATSWTTDVGYYLLCPAGDGHVAIETVEPSVPGDIGALRITAGDLSSAMQPVAPPVEVGPMLADRLRLGLACLPDGVVLLNADKAWELRDGTWERRPAQLAATLYEVVEPAVTPLPDGTLVAGAVQRDADGTWRAHDPTEQVATLGETVIRFRPHR